MPVQINITGDNAEQAILEFSVLSAAFVANTQTAATVAAPVQEDKPKRNIPKAKQEAAADPVSEETSTEPESKKIDIDKLTDDEGSRVEKVPDVTELRAAAAAVGTTPEAKAKIKELLDKYEARNLSAVPDNQKAAFLADLKALADE